MTARPRPLSPHLSIYKFTLTMATSIIHRGTGIARRQCRLGRLHLLLCRVERPTRVGELARQLAQQAGGVGYAFFARSISPGACCAS